MYIIGIMSGTSLDGCDAVLVDFSEKYKSCTILQQHHIPFDETMKYALLELQKSSDNELHKSAILANQLSVEYARLVKELLLKANIKPENIKAIGCHGQTIRHQPRIENSVHGYTIQIHNPSLLAELTSIDVIANFREPDIAAGGQGAPLVPAFHAYIFDDYIHNVNNINKEYQTIICNIGGMSNITVLAKHKPVLGMDCGSGNVLLDAWINKHIQKSYDKNGVWAQGGCLNLDLLNKLMSHPYFNEAPPKSTGREVFNLALIEQALKAISNADNNNIKAEDVQCTLVHFTAKAIAQHVINYTYHHTFDVNVQHYIFICGGGAYNNFLLSTIQYYLPNYVVDITDALGIGAQNVECAAFAWLAHQYIHNVPSNIIDVTGAVRPKVLGALYKGRNITNQPTM